MVLKQGYEEDGTASKEEDILIEKGGQVKEGEE